MFWMHRFELEPNKDSEKMWIVELNVYSVGMAEFTRLTPQICFHRASNITEVITFCGLRNRRSTGLSTSPETQTLLVPIQYA